VNYPESNNMQIYIQSSK